MLACEELTKLVDWGSESGQVDLDIAAALGNFCGDPDVAAAVTIVVQKRLAVENPVLPGRYHCAGLLLGGIENGFHRGLDDRRTEFRKQPRQPALPQMRRTDHRRQIAAKIAGVADIQSQQIEQVVAQLARFIEPDRRNAEALLPDFGGARVIAAMGRAADVALMRAHDGPVQAPVAIEDRHEGRQVGQMAAAMIGVVEQKDVTGADVPEPLLHGKRRPRQRADMHRDVIGLCDQAAAGVADGEREIATGVQYLRVGGAKHRLAHFRHDRAQPVLNDGACDGIYLDGHCRPA